MVPPTVNAISRWSSGIQKHMTVLTTYIMILVDIGWFFQPCSKRHRSRFTRHLLNSDLGKEYWGGTETYNISSVNAWVKGAKSLVLPAGTYIIGYRADTNCDNGIYIDTGINTSNLALPLFEKNINIPPSNLSVNMATYRSGHNTVMITLANETTLFFYCWSTSPIVIQYELWAMRIK